MAYFWGHRESLGPLAHKDPNSGNILSLFLCERGQKALQRSTTCVSHVQTSFSSWLHSDHKFWRPSPSLKAKLQSQWCRLSLFTPHKCFSYSSFCSTTVDAEPLIKKDLQFQILYVCWSYPGIWVYVTPTKWDIIFKKLWDTWTRIYI